MALSKIYKEMRSILFSRSLGAVLIPYPPGISGIRVCYRDAHAELLLDLLVLLVDFSLFEVELGARDLISLALGHVSATGVLLRVQVVREVVVVAQVHRLLGSQQLFHL